MGQHDARDRRNKSPYHDYFKMMFESADLISSYWQPMFKGIGRGQLELAHLSARQGQAVLQWGRSLATCLTPADMLAANVQLWQTVAGQCADASQKLASAAAQAAQAPEAFELLTLPVAKRGHDTLVLPETDADDDAAHRRRVA